MLIGVALLVFVKMTDHPEPTLLINSILRRTQAEILLGLRMLRHFIIFPIIVSRYFLQDFYFVREFLESKRSGIA